MKKTLLPLCFATVVVLAACNNSNQNKLNKTEEKAVEAQIEKDQTAMDSLEKVIQAQINGEDSAKD